MTAESPPPGLDQGLDRVFNYIDSLGQAPRETTTVPRTMPSEPSDYLSSIRRSIVLDDNVPAEVKQIDRAVLSKLAEKTGACQVEATVDPEYEYQEAISRDGTRYEVSRVSHYRLGFTLTWTGKSSFPEPVNATLERWASQAIESNPAFAVVLYRCGIPSKKNLGGIFKIWLHPEPVPQPEPIENHPAYEHIRSFHEPPPEPYTPPKRRRALDLNQDHE